MAIALLKFESSTCQPCKLMEPILKSMDIPYTVLDAERDHLQFAAFKIRTVPTIVVMDDDCVLGSMTGMKTKAQIEAFIEKVQE
jgi:thioredoxin-like negative regulator of GroEL